MRTIKILIIWIVQCVLSYVQYLLLYAFTTQKDTPGAGEGFIEIVLIYLIPIVSMIILMIVFKAKNDSGISSSATGTSIVFPAIMTIIVVISYIKATGNFWMGVWSLLIFGVIYMIAGVGLALLFSHFLGMKYSYGSSYPNTVSGSDTKEEDPLPAGQKQSIHERPIYLNDSFIGKGTKVGEILETGIIIKGDRSWFSGSTEVGRVVPGGYIEKGTGWQRENAGRVDSLGYVMDRNGDYLGIVKPNGNVYKLVKGIFGSTPDMYPIGTVNPGDYEAGAALILLLIRDESL